MKQNEIKAKMQGMDSLTPPPRDEMLDRLGVSSGEPLTAPVTPPAAGHAPRRFLKPLMVGVAAALAVSLLTVGAVAAVNENREYREALTNLRQYGIPTDGMTRAEIKEAWRTFSVSSGGGEAQEAVIHGNELILCNEEEAKAALSAIGSVSIATDPSPLLASLYSSAYNAPYRQCSTDEQGQWYSDIRVYPAGTAVVGKAANPDAQDESWLWRTDVSPLECVGISEYGDTLIVTGMKERLSKTDERVSVICLSAETGQILWRTDTLPEGAVSAMPMSVVPDEDGITVFCRAVCGEGPRLSRMYRLVTLRLAWDGSILGTAQSELMNLFIAQESKKLSDGWCVRLEDLQGLESGDKYPYEFVYIDDTLAIRNRYRLTIGEALAAYETAAGTAYAPAGNNSGINIGSGTSFVSVVQMEECNDIIWLSGCTANLYDEQAYQPLAGQNPASDFMPYKRLTGLSDPVIAKLRKQCAAYLLAWDPIAGEVKYFCTAPGCFIPTGCYPLRTSSSGDVSWTVCSVVGYEPVSRYISSMSAFVTAAVYENIFDTAGGVTSRFMGGVTVRY